jgi:hypothetical protein
MKDEVLVIVVCQKRIAATKTYLEEQSDIGEFMPKKCKLSADCLLPLSVFACVDDLPRLDTSAGVNGTEMGEAKRLELPPLKMKPVRGRRRVSIVCGRLANRLK